MSLTSYRAAPPRDNSCFLDPAFAATPIADTCSKRARSWNYNSPTDRKNRRVGAAVFCKSIIVSRGSVLGRPGSDLLSQVLRLSTISAGDFNGRVRNGIGFRLPAKTTRPAKDRNQTSDVSNQNRILKTAYDCWKQADLSCRFLITDF